MNGIEFRVAKNKDLEKVLALHYRYQVDSIDKNDKADGFITTAFNTDQLSELINNENGLFVATKEGEIIAYAMAASWGFWSKWPMFAHMIKDLPNLTYANQKLSILNSYQYGPVCVDKSVRGEGVFAGIFNFALNEMSNRYPILVTFINKNNPRSYAAHVNKAGLDVIQEFEFNKNYYYQLACVTSRA